MSSSSFARKLHSNLEAKLLLMLIYDLSFPNQCRTQHVNKRFIAYFYLCDLSVQLERKLSGK